MSRPLFVLNCARVDLEQAIEWYERQVPGLGESLFLNVEGVLDRIEQYPELYQVDFGTVRRALTDRFSYAIYYRILAEVIEIVAILDCRSDPATVRARSSASGDH